MSKIFTGLLKLRTAYDAILSIVPSPHDRYVIAKDELDQQWQAEMLPVIQRMYWHPIRAGIDDAPDDADSLRQWLRDKYDDAAFIALLIYILQKYHIRASELGGQYTLDELVIRRTFRLSNMEYLQMIIDRTRELVDFDTDISLLDTTINELAVEVQKAKNNKDNKDPMLILGLFIAARAPVRTTMIERYERPWSVANAQTWTAQKNGIRYKMYDENYEGCKEACNPWHGRVIEVTGIDSKIIPQHPGCDCLWQPIRQNGQRLGNPPVTVNVPGLEPWQQPAVPWTGGN